MFLTSSSIGKTQSGLNHVTYLKNIPRLMQASSKAFVSYISGLLSYFKFQKKMRRRTFCSRAPCAPKQLELWIQNRARHKDNHFEYLF